MVLAWLCQAFIDPPFSNPEIPTTLTRYNWRDRDVGCLGCNKWCGAKSSFGCLDVNARLFSWALEGVCGCSGGGWGRGRVVDACGRQMICDASSGCCDALGWSGVGGKKRCEDLDLVT